MKRRFTSPSTQMVSEEQFKMTGVAIRSLVEWYQRRVANLPKPPPSHSAERTRSPHYRAGTRRTKKHARRQR